MMAVFRLLLNVLVITALPLAGGFREEFAFGTTMAMMLICLCCIGIVKSGQADASGRAPKDIELEGVDKVSDDSGTDDRASDEMAATSGLLRSDSSGAMAASSKELPYRGVAALLGHTCDAIIETFESVSVSVSHSPGGKQGKYVQVESGPQLDQSPPVTR